VNNSKNNNIQETDPYFTGSLGKIFEAITVVLDLRNFSHEKNSIIV